MPVYNCVICSGQQGRESWQPPDKIMDAIGVKPGMVIGEVGAGTGFFTFYLSQRIGNEGFIYANDISIRGLESIRSRAQNEGIGNIMTVTGGIDDPLFPVNNLDMSVMVYVLHEITHPVPFLKNLKKYLKNGGLLVIIERRTNEDKYHIPAFLGSSEVLSFADESGFEHVRTETFLRHDNIYIFKK